MHATSTPEQNHVVVLVHGIRTHAAWAEMVADVISHEMHATVFPIRYGFFDTLRFLFPLFTRASPIRKVLRELRDLRTQLPSACISVIAHSFGTYAIYKLLNERDIKLSRVIFCGSVVPEHFRRTDFEAQLGPDPILNDCGSNDIWPILARSITWGYGATGTFGFGTYGVRDQFNNFGHDDYLNRTYIRKYWIPFLDRGDVTPTGWELDRSPPPYWHSLLSWLPLRWILVTIMCGLGIFAIHITTPLQVNVAWRSFNTITRYSSTVTIVGSKDECQAGKCIITFRDAAFLVAGRNQDAIYEGRAKTSGRIISIKSEPPLEILNPNQYPGNPTYVQFRIQPSTDDKHVLQASGELIIEQKVTPQGGKIGPHFPYYTEYVVFTLDLRGLGFELKDPIEVKIESQTADGRLVSGYFFPRINYYEKGKVIMITARGLPAGSSIYAAWGR